MLRRYQNLPKVPRLSNARQRSAAAVVENFQETIEEDGYGMEYGAGPSRIPYQPRAMPDGAAEFEINAPQFAPASTISSSRRLRQNLASLQHGDYVSLDIFARKALTAAVSDKSVKKKHRPIPQPLSTYSRLELHTVVHHLLRSRQPILAAAVISNAASVGIASRPRRRRIFASRTLELLFDEIKVAPFARESRSRSKWKRLVEIKTNFTSNQQSVATTTHTLSDESQTLLTLLDSLQDIRQRRPNVMYEILIRQCVREGRPDVAAKIFVGLVEEWVTEGRVAEGADIEDFCEGGGPSERLEMQLVSDQMSAWWKGVRTWAWPGEVLSPHGRLDLWHPKNLSLGEKMKGFPMPVPTSPPTMVPAPDNDLLIDIIESLRLDPAKSTAMEHTTSMRALAYLANTVLSRTLPISSLRSLFHAMSATVHRPPVYPEGIDPGKIVQSELWAYESFTQIHLALQSLLSAPPMSANSIKYAQSVERAQAGNPGSPPHPPPAQSGYMLPPLTWTSCIVLLRYGMSRLKMPRLAGSLVAYMKQVFGAGHTAPAAHNIMLESATRMRDDPMARMVARPLFGEGIAEQLSRPGDIIEQPVSVSDTPTPTGEHLALGHPDSRLQPIADERSLTSLITHLTATSQHSVLERLVYKLIPYLSFDSKTNARLHTTQPPPPEALPLSLYPVLLSGLRNAGKTGLAQRVFSLAKLAEAGLIESTMARYGPTPDAGFPRLSIEAYTHMIDIYANEVRATRPGKEWVKGWRHKEGEGVHRRDIAAANMAWRTYNDARNRWRNASNEIDQARCAPNLDFFLAITRACEQRWLLKQPGSLDRRLLGELQSVSKDMADFNIPLHKHVSEKLDLEPSIQWTEMGRHRSEADPAITLAEMWLKGEAGGTDKSHTS
jgi:hypothetical protein